MRFRTAKTTMKRRMAPIASMSKDVLFAGAG
jgi:hypothetical protein